MTITADVLILGTGCTRSLAAIWLPHVNAALDEFGIADPLDCAAFLPNVGVESGALTQMIESTNYGAQGLADTWPGRYAKNPKAKGGASDPFVPNDVATSIARNPKAIANLTYANRMGNGTPESGDGYKYRGRGLFQITGKSMYALCGKALGIDLVANPDAILEPKDAARSAAWYYTYKGCDKAVRANGFAKVVEIINGRPPAKANHGPERIAKFDAVLAKLTA